MESELVAMSDKVVWFEGWREGLGREGVEEAKSQDKRSTYHDRDQLTSPTYIKSPTYSLPSPTM